MDRCGDDCCGDEVMVVMAVVMVVVVVKAVVYGSETKGVVTYSNVFPTLSFPLLCYLSGSCRHHFVEVDAFCFAERRPRHQTYINFIGLSPFGICGGTNI